MLIDSQKFDEAATKAFAFLIEDYGYTGIPSPKKTHFLQANTKSFNSDNVLITFGASVDIADRFYVCFSPTYLRELGHPEVVEYKFLFFYSLKHLLASKKINLTLPREGGTEVFDVFARATKQYAQEVIKGDFSAFPPLCFLVENTHTGAQGTKLAPFIRGVFSTAEKAEQYIDSRSKKLRGGGKNEIRIIVRAMDDGSPW